MGEDRKQVRASFRTVLRIGAVEIPVAAIKAHGDPEESRAEFVTAGPNGGELRAQSYAVPSSSGATGNVEIKGDPLADSPAADGWSEVASSAPVAAEYRRQLVEEGTGEVVPPESVRRGVRVDGKFIDCTEQLEAITERTKIERAEIAGFIDITHVARARVIGAYYLAPEAGGGKALRILRDACQRTRRCAAVKLTKKSKQTLGVIGWYDKAVVLYEIVWSAQFREPPERALLIEQAEVADAQVENAVRLVQAMSATPELLDGLRDDAVALKDRLYERALRGEIEADLADVEEMNNIDSRLMEQLEASLAAVAA